LKPDISKHSKIIEFGSIANTESYVPAGWKLMPLPKNTECEGVT